MLAFFRRMLKDKWKSFVIYSVAAIGFVEMYIAMFPSIQKQANEFDQMIKNFPQEIFKAMNIDVSSLSFGSLESYMSTEYLSFLWPIMAIIFAISLANYICVNEIDKGTMETLASLPARRSRVFIERYLAGLILILGFCIISMFAIVPFAELHGVEYLFENLFTASIGSFLLAWAVFSLAVLSSVFFSEKGKATMASGGLLILMYVANVISNLNDDLQNLQYVSFFNYFNGMELLGHNTFPEYTIVALCGFAIIVSGLALYRFSNRDLSV